MSFRAHAGCFARRRPHETARRALGAKIGPQWVTLEQSDRQEFVTPNVFPDTLIIPFLNARI